MARTKQVALSRYQSLAIWDHFWSRLTTKTLPIEIIEAIVGQVTTARYLYSLLTVSKTVFTVACKALYSNPARLGLCSDNTLNNLFDMLLAHSPLDDDETSLCRELRGVQKLSSQPYVDYLAMVQTYDFAEHDYGSASGFFLRSASDLFLESSLVANSLMERRQLSLREAMGWMCNTIMWAAVSSNISGIRRLTIHADYIQQYISLVPAMTNLQHVAFNIHPDFLSDGDHITRHEMALKFVEHFVQHHGHRQLKTARFSNMTGWFYPDECQEIEGRIQKLLGPPRNVTSIGFANWPMFLSFADIIDLTNVKHFKQLVLQSCSWESFAAHWPNLTPQSILQRCRSLEELTVWYSDPDLLKWAVAERNTHKAIGEPQKLVPLKSTNFVCRSDILASVCDDLFQAFEETLEEVSISYASGGEPLAALTIGREWRSAAALWTLNIVTSSAIITHPDAFKATPALKQLYLQDFGRQLDNNNLEVGEHGSQSIWDLPELQWLKLSGYAADNLDPRSFAYMPKLQSIDLGGHLANRRCFLPRPGSAAEIQNQLWTWDIALPQLANLSLSGHHALRFRFNFVTLCPNLASLRLDVGGHRVVLSDDLDVCLDKDTAAAMSGQQKQSEGTEPSSSDNITVSSDNSCASSVSHGLHTLELKGRFVISDDALTFMLTRLFPLLDTLTMHNCKRYTIENLVELAEAHRRLNLVATTRQPTRQQVQVLRLERPRRVPKRYRTSHQTTEASLWYNRYHKSHFETLNGNPPVDAMHFGRCVEVLPPYCIYQMGRYWNLFRRSFYA
ncbi:hypothetical protein BGZ73_002861 [Actinomortierella ambigua]|nr:hypothetical protein BGZ73_002861 [Actinomortierella ambigua]